MLFLWLNYYYNNLPIVAITSLILAILIGQILSIFYKKKKNILNLNSKEQAHIKEISSKFMLTSDKIILNFYYTILSASHVVIKEKSYLRWDDYVFIPYYKKSVIDSDVIANIYKEHISTQGIIISGVEFSDNAKTLCSNLPINIHLLDEYQTYQLFKKYNSFPNFNIKLKDNKINKKEVIKSTIFSKKNSKHYFISGIIILISSLFIRYSIYYIVFATLLFIFSAISFFKKPKHIDTIIDKL